MSDELERLADRGRQLAANQEDVISTQAPVDAEADEARRRLRASVSRFVRWGWVVLGAFGWGLTVFVVGAVAPESWHEGGDEGSPAIGIGGLVGLLVAIAAWRLRPTMGERAIAREEAWVCARPFLLTGHLDVLARRETEGAFRLVFELDTPRAPADAAATFRSPATRSTPPSEALLADVFRTVGAQVRSDSVADFWEVEHVWDFRDNEHSVLTNAHVHTWMHQVVAVLETLHARHPVRSVSVLGFVPLGAQRTSSS